MNSGGTRRSAGGGDPMLAARRAVAVAVVVAGTAGVLAAAPAGADGPLPSGSLVLIGGNLGEDDQILQRIVDLADPDGEGPLPARIAIVTAAAATAKNPAKARKDVYNNAAANGVYYSGLFESFGAETYAGPIDTRVDWKKDPYVPANADDPAVAAEIGRSTGVFFGGGDQMRYVRTLLRCQPAPDEAFTSCTDTAAMAAIRDVVDAGGVVAGLSAGTTIQQGPNMVTGGESYEGWRDGAAPGYFDDATKLAYLPYGGFGFFPEGLVDSHFTTWGRQARMVRLGAAVGEDRVVGVGETAALVCGRATRTADVIGRNGVSLLDLSAAAVSGAPGSSAAGVRWTYLVAGDRVDFASGTVTPASAPTTALGTGAGPAPVADVWDSIAAPSVGEYTLVDQALALVRSGATEASGTTLETAPQYTTVLTRAAGTTPWWDGGFGDLGISIFPTQG
jgi:cyanophycinase